MHQSSVSLRRICHRNIMFKEWLKLSLLASPQWRQPRGIHPSYWLGILMGLFYYARWSQGQMPASTKGLMFPPENFYLYGAIISPLMWPVLTGMTAGLLKRLSQSKQASAMKFSYAYSAPLFVWLGCLEFLIWTLCPPSRFGPIALGVMFIAMLVVYIQCFRLFDHEHHSPLSRHLRTMSGLFPQLLVATLIFR
jgi:hypothetical protein